MTDPEPFPELETEQKYWAVDSDDFQLRLHFSGNGPQWQTFRMHIFTDRSRHHFDLRNVDLQHFADSLNEMIDFAYANNTRPTGWENAE